MELITAHELRHDLAISQRMKKTQDKWIGWCNQYAAFESISAHNSVTIGAKINFTSTTRSGNNYTMTSREGVVFAIGCTGVKIVVASKGRLYTIKNEQEA